MSSYNHLVNAVQLGDNELRRLAPSIFADEPHESRSAKFECVNTARILVSMQAEGFVPVAARQSNPRDEERRGYTKHEIRLRHVRDLGAAKAGNEFNEIIMANAADGTGALRLGKGRFRQVCANGMYCGRVDEDITVLHRKGAEFEAITAAYDVLAQLKEVDAFVEQMRQIELTSMEQTEMAVMALTFRYGDLAKSPVKPQHLLAANRREDNEPSLWLTFNRIQENSIKGGVSGYTANNRRTTTRPIVNIPQSAAINRALWAHALDMLGRKQIAA